MAPTAFLMGCHISHFEEVAAVGICVEVVHLEKSSVQLEDQSSQTTVFFSVGEEETGDNDGSVSAAFMFILPETAHPPSAVCSFNRAGHRQIVLSEN